MSAQSEITFTFQSRYNAKPQRYGLNRAPRVFCDLMAVMLNHIVRGREVDKSISPGEKQQIDKTSTVLSTKSTLQEQSLLNSLVINTASGHLSITVGKQRNVQNGSHLLGHTLVNIFPSLFIASCLPFGQKNTGELSHLNRISCQKIQQQTSVSGRQCFFIRACGRGK